jgi:UDP-N-acetylmuramoyl-tripeptide--D-alanyl-D-alanine ligase
VFTVNEILKATKGNLLCGNKDTVIRGISIDSRTIKSGEAFIAIKGNNFNGQDFIKEAISRKAKAVVVSLPVAPARPAGGRCPLPVGVPFIKVKDTTKALGDIARFYREKFDIPIIVVTGSNGKTTAKEMIAWALSKKFKVLRNEGTKNNQIGLPLTLLNLDKLYNFAILEAGTNHPGEIEYLAKIAQPNVGIITNIGPAHLEFLKDLRGVFKEKRALMRHLKQPYITILNADDNLLRKETIRKVKRPAIFSFGVKHKADFSASHIKILNGKIEFVVNKKYKFQLKTFGYYNVYNALIAISVARIFGMEYNDIALGLSHFDFPQSRLCLIELNSIKFIDDSYNSNPISLEQALDTLDNFHTKGRKIFVMGDMLELGNDKDLFHQQAGERVARVCDAFITVGGLSKKTAEAAKSLGFDINNIFSCGNSSQARDILFNKVVPNSDDIILVKGSRMMKMEEIFKV